MNEENQANEAYLTEILSQYPNRHDEIAAFWWFTRAIDLQLDHFLISERPDFIVEVGTKKIGIEITQASRETGNTTYSSHQIESAQNRFSEVLLKSISPAIPLDVGLIFEDDVPVGRDANQLASSVIAPLINEISKSMMRHSVEIIVRSESDLPNSNYNKHEFSRLPGFLHYIQLLNDDHLATVGTASRGGVLEYFSKDELELILDKKHSTLNGFQRCDEHWLVITSGQTFPLATPPAPLAPSMATAFAGVDIQGPIESSFDRVFFFKSPSDVTLLTKPLAQ